MRRSIPAVVALLLVLGMRVRGEDSSSPKGDTEGRTVLHPDLIVSIAPPNKADGEENSAVITFKNNGKKPIKLLKAMDGSEWCRLMPYYRTTVTDGEKKVLDLGARCGVIGYWGDMKWPEDYVLELGPGKTYEKTLYLPQAVPATGKYKVTFEYEFEPTAKAQERWKYPPGLWKGKVKSEPIELKLRKTVP
jgi:hypothetical protein